MATQVSIEYGLRLNRLLNNNLSYEIFRSEICHMYHFDGDSLFISKVMETNLVIVLWTKKEYAKYLVAKEYKKVNRANPEAEIIIVGGASRS